MKNLFKYFENYFLSLIVKFFRKAKTKKKIPLDDDSKLLIIILRNNSEALLTTPLIRIIKKNSNAQISILTNLDNRNVFKNNSDIDQIYIAENTFSNILSHSKTLRNINYDVLINSGEIYSEAEIIYSALLKAKYKIGFADIEDKIFSHLIQKPNPVVTHFVDRTLHLCDYFYFEVDKTNLNLNCSTTKDADDEIDRFLLSVFDSSKLLVIINISSEINKNFWGVENYKKLINYIKNYDVNIVISTSENDIDLADKISNNKEKIYFSDEYDKYAALISKSHFIFTPNSFTLQLSAAFKKPVFCLFSKSDNNELIRVPYNSDFDFILSEQADFSDLHFGKVLNSFIPYFDYVYERYRNKTFD